MKKLAWMTLAVVATAGLTLGASQAMTARPTAVAVLDVESVFNQAQLVVKLTAEVKGAQREMDDEVKRMEEQLKAEEKDLTLIADKGSAAFNEQAERVERLAYQYRALGQYRQASLRRMEAEQNERLYREMRDSVRRVAERNGVDIVLFKDEVTAFPKTIEGVRALIGTTKVLYAKNELDLTKEVIQDMDNMAAK